MMRRAILFITAVAGLLAGGCVDVSVSHAEEAAAVTGLIGAWRGKVQFANGAFAAVKNLEFMYAFNAGGTMMESSNYDGAPPVPPAYGAWRKTGPRQYEAKYSCFFTKAPAAFEDIAKGGGWLPGGWAVLVEKITVAEDGKSFRSAITLDIFDQTGKPTESGSVGEVVASRVSF